LHPHVRPALFPRRCDLDNYRGVNETVQISRLIPGVPLTCFPLRPGNSRKTLRILPPFLALPRSARILLFSWQLVGAAQCAAYSDSYSCSSSPLPLSSV